MTELAAQTLLAGRYRVEAFVGRGGMAEVYKVWDTRRATDLAMKLLREDMALDKVFLRRFKREAQTLARLQHPSIVRFYGLEQDGQLAFMLMDFVEGRSLKHDIFDLGGPMPAQRVLEIMRPVCSALHYAHGEGFVHCDVKPGNILIDNLGRILVSDFGVSRMTDAATATMVGAGTPAYMAPEQIRGEELTPQTDIYGLGVVLYEMLTGGERPFTGDHARTSGSTSEKVRWEHLNVEPVSPRKYNKKLSSEQEAVVMRCLAKEPTDRFATALDLFNALQSTPRSATIAEQPSPVVDEREALAQTVPMPEPDLAYTPPAPRGVVPKRRTPGWAVALVGVLVVAGVIGSLALGIAPGNRTSAAITPVAPVPTRLPAVPTDWPTVAPTDRPTAVPTDQPIPTVAATFAVDARRTWQDTGITVNTGDTVMIEYVSGEWTTWMGGHPYVEADGNERIGDPRNTNHPVPSAFPGVLIAKVANGTPQEIGMSRTLQFETSGTLYLEMNDDYLGDNDGQLIVQIVVSRTTAGSSPTDISIEGIPEWLGEEGLIAHYPLQSDGYDITGNYGSMRLDNAPFQGEGIYCNGIYEFLYEGVPNPCVVMTPQLETIDFNSFSISASFMVTEYTYTATEDGFMPVFVGGDSYRWIGFMLTPDGNMRLLYNNSETEPCSSIYRLDTWYEATVTYDGQVGKLYLDRSPLCEVKFSLLHGNDKNIGLTNYSNGGVFKGHFRDLRIYNTVLEPSP